MTQTFEYSPLSKPRDREHLTQILSRCFGVSASGWETYFVRVGPENFRILRRADEVAGGLAIYFMGQWFGGQSVPMAGIAAVSVAPELRGAGVAFELMARTLRELQETGIPLSSLYASTQRLYRRVGYEQAGSRCKFTMPTRAIGIEDRVLSVRPLDPTRHEVFHDLYRAQAKRGSGHLDRSRAIWERMANPREGEKAIYAYLVGKEKDAVPEGYVVFTQPENNGGYDLLVRDLVALSPGAARRIVTFFADHRSLAREVTWYGPPTDPLTCLLPEQEARIKHVERWMMRIVDVSKALAMRGYPAGLETELHLEVGDDLLPGNQGRIVLSVANGRGEVTPGGRGELKFEVGGLAPLYSGFLTPLELASVGLLAGSPEALAAAALVFAGPEPWMADYF